MIQKLFFYPGLEGVMPQGKVLHMEAAPHGVMATQLTVWLEVKVNDDLHPVDPLRVVGAYPTGATPPDHHEHLASAVSGDGLVWHLYDRGEGKADD